MQDVVNSLLDDYGGRRDHAQQQNLQSDLNLFPGSISNMEAADDILAEQSIENIFNDSHHAEYTAIPLPSSTSSIIQEQPQHLLENHNDSQTSSPPPPFASDIINQSQTLLENMNDSQLPSPSPALPSSASIASDTIDLSIKVVDYLGGSSHSLSEQQINQSQQGQEEENIGGMFMPVLKATSAELSSNSQIAEMVQGNTQLVTSSHSAIIIKGGDVKSPELQSYEGLVQSLSASLNSNSDKVLPADKLERVRVVVSTAVPQLNAKSDKVLPSDKLERVRAVISTAVPQTQHLQLSSTLNRTSPNSNTLSRSHTSIILSPRASTTSRYGITKEELGELVSFDNRDDPNQLAMINSEKYGGITGISLLLKSDIVKGLPVKKSKQNKWDSSESLLDDLRNGTDAGKRRPWWKFWESQDTTYPKAIEKKVKVGHVLDSAFRIQNFGKNLIAPPDPVSIPRMIYDKVREDTILKVLIVSSIIALIVGLLRDPVEGWVDSMAIIIAVVLVSTVTSINDYTKEKKFKKLLLLQSAKRVRVIRDGTRDEISSWDLLVGDIVELGIGDEVPADGLYIRGNNLIIDESPLTGESRAVRKDAKNIFVFSGCQVSDGEGFMLVTAVGANSTGGKIQEKLSERQNELTPLQVKLTRVAAIIGYVGLAAAGVTFLALIIRWGITFAARKAAGDSIDPKAEIFTVLQFLILSVTILVVAVPEGLPISVTMSLGFSMFKMMKENCFVRQLQSSETMGAATCICTDKTGTLTENRMTVVRAMFGDRVFNGEGSGISNSKPFHSRTMAVELRDLVAENVAVNTTCFLKAGKDKSRPLFVGSATEGSMLVFIDKLGVQYERIRKMVPKVDDGTWLFDSTRKAMSTLVYPGTQAPTVSNQEDYKYCLHAKGAPENILAQCSHFVDKRGTTCRVLTAEDHTRFTKVIKQWASDGLRTIALAYRHTFIHPNEEQSSLSPEGKICPEHDLVLIGFLGIKDPVRPLVPQAVKETQDAGLFVRMVTGDNLLTASKIAQECGILKPGGIAIEGRRFRVLKRDDKMKLLPHLHVLARSSPLDKLELVKLLKEMGEVVAVTGDGTNDAPALKEADVGFAMGISGTQIAINSSDIVLLDDNFISIVAAIKWGRNVLNSVRKFLQFQLSVNFTTVFSTIISSAITGVSLMDSAELLWVNLIMDSFGALSLASEEPDSSVFSQPPHKRDAGMLSAPMKLYIFSQTVFQVSLLISMDYMMQPVVKMLYPSITDSDTIALHVSTMIVTSFVILQIFSQVMSRQLANEIHIFKGIFQNRLFVAVQVIIFVIQVLLVQVGYQFFGAIPMNFMQWLICIGIAALNMPFIVIVRLIAKFTIAQIDLYKTLKSKRRICKCCCRGGDHMG